MFALPPIADIQQRGGCVGRDLNAASIVPRATFVLSLRRRDCELCLSVTSAATAAKKSCFGLDDLATEQLIRDATAADRSAVDLYHFTRRLNGALDSEGRQRLVKMMVASRLC
jgi:hypothetical protein